MHAKINTFKHMNVCNNVPHDKVSSFTKKKTQTPKSWDVLKIIAVSKKKPEEVNDIKKKFISHIWYMW